MFIISGNFWLKIGRQKKKYGFEYNTVEFTYSELLYKKYFSIVNSEQFPSSYWCNVKQFGYKKVRL